LSRLCGWRCLDLLVKPPDIPAAVILALRSDRLRSFDTERLATA
jgi:hypothetical protein